MLCCFMNLHEKENEKDLIKHFDKEIDNAIARGCTSFLTGTKYPEDEIFAERVKNAAKYYKDGEIKLILMEESDEKLKKRFIEIADWEIYSFNTDDYPMYTK